MDPTDVELLTKVYKWVASISSLNLISRLSSLAHVVHQECI